MESTNNKDMIAASIIADIENIRKIFLAIQEAARSIPTISELEKKNELNIKEKTKLLLPYNIDGITRLEQRYRIQLNKIKNIFKGNKDDKLVINPKAEEITDSSYTLEYDPNTITIMGGAALNVYTTLLSKYIKTKGIIELKDYVKRETTDIDIVWWPNYNKEDKAIISASPIIKKFVENLTKKIEETISTVKITGIKNLTVDNNINQIATTKFDDSLTSKYKFGSFQIYIYGETEKEKNIKLVDFTIHDTASGQRTSEKNSPICINCIKPMEDDPTYINSVTIHKINDINIPKISTFIKQQKYAFNNNPEKRKVYYYRLLYIEELLRNVTTNNNTHNITSVFGEDITQNAIKTNLQNLNKINSTIQKFVSEERVDTLKKELEILEKDRKDINIKYDNIIKDVEAPIRHINRLKKKSEIPTFKDITEAKQAKEHIIEITKKRETVIANINKKIEDIEKQLKMIPIFDKLPIIEPKVTLVPNNSKFGPLLATPPNNTVKVATSVPVAVQAPAAVPAAVPGAVPVPVQYAIPQGYQMQPVQSRYIKQNEFKDPKDGSIIEVQYNTQLQTPFYKHYIIDSLTGKYKLYNPQSSQEIHLQQSYLQQRYKEYLDHLAKQQQGYHQIHYQGAPMHYQGIQMHYQGYPMQQQGYQMHYQGGPMQQQGYQRKGKGKGLKGGNITTRKKSKSRRTTHKK